MHRFDNCDPLLMIKDEKAYFKRHPYLRQQTIALQTEERMFLEAQRMCPKLSNDWAKTPIYKMTSKGISELDALIK